jgi:hypothetical protein
MLRAMLDRAAVLPVAGEISEATRDQIAEGQPLLLLCNREPATLIDDLESWAEAAACDEVGPVPDTA